MSRRLSAEMLEQEKQMNHDPSPANPAPRAGGHVLTLNPKERKRKLLTQVTRCSTDELLMCVPDDKKKIGTNGYYWHIAKCAHQNSSVQNSHSKSPMTLLFSYPQWKVLSVVFLAPEKLLH